MKIEASHVNHYHLNSHEVSTVINHRMVNILKTSVPFKKLTKHKKKRVVIKIKKFT